MTPLSPQVPWLKSAPTSQIFTTARSRKSMRINLRSWKKARLRLSGDQNGAKAPSVFGRTCDLRSPTGRTQRRFGPVDPDAGAAVNANWDPSGDNASNIRPGAMLNSVPSGGGTSKRYCEGATDGPQRGRP